MRAPLARLAAPLVLALLLAVPSCAPSYDLPRTAAELPPDRALVLGLVPHESKHDLWYVRLERSGAAEIEIGVPRAGGHVFLWSLPPGEYRITSMRRARHDTSGRGPSPSAASIESVFEATDTPWVELLPGKAYCVGTLAADIDRHPAFLASVKGTVYYDAHCDFSFLPPEDRPERRWSSLPWAKLGLEPLPLLPRRTPPPPPTPAPPPVPASAPSAPASAAPPPALAP